MKSDQILTVVESGNFAPPGPVRMCSFFGPLAGPIFGYDFFASSLREFLSFCRRRFDREFLNRPLDTSELCCCGRCVRPVALVAAVGLVLARRVVGVLGLSGHSGLILVTLVSQVVICRSKNDHFWPKSGQNGHLAQIFFFLSESIPFVLTS